MDVKTKVREFIGKFIGDNTITDEDNIFEKRLVSSLFSMQLVNFIEKEFHVELSNDDLEIDNFKNINSIVALIEKKAEE